MIWEWWKFEPCLIIKLRSIRMSEHFAIALHTKIRWMLRSIVQSKIFEQKIQHFEH